MRCIETQTAAAVDSRRQAALAACAVAVVLIAGCASPIAPPPAPAPGSTPKASPAPAPAPRPAPAPMPAPAPAPAPEPTFSPPAESRAPVDLGPKVNLPAPATARSWDEFKKLAARRMVAASPKASYMGKPQAMLFGIPILEIELNGDGSVRSISVTRPPANIDAQNTIDYAMEAIRRGAPYGDVSRLPKPWKWTETFLFDDKRKFKPRSLE